MSSVPAKARKPRRLTTTARPSQDDHDTESKPRPERPEHDDHDAPSRTSPARKLPVVKPRPNARRSSVASLQHGAEDRDEPRGTSTASKLLQSTASSQAKVKVRAKKLVATVDKPSVRIADKVDHASTAKSITQLGGPAKEPQRSDTKPASHGDEIPERVPSAFAPRGGRTILRPVPQKGDGEGEAPREVKTGKQGKQGTEAVPDVKKDSAAQGGGGLAQDLKPTAPKNVRPNGGKIDEGEGDSAVPQETASAVAPDRKQRKLPPATEEGKAGSGEAQKDAGADKTAAPTPALQPVAAKDNVAGEEDGPATRIKSGKPMTTEKGEKEVDKVAARPSDGPVTVMDGPQAPPPREPRISKPIDQDEYKQLRDELGPKPFQRMPKIKGAAKPDLAKAMEELSPNDREDLEKDSYYRPRDDISVNQAKHQLFQLAGFAEQDFQRRGMRLPRWRNGIELEQTYDDAVRQLAETTSALKQAEGDLVKAQVREKAFAAKHGSTADADRSGALDVVAGDVHRDVAQARSDIKELEAQLDDRRSAAHWIAQLYKMHQAGLAKAYENRARAKGVDGGSLPMLGLGKASADQGLNKAAKVNVPAKLQKGLLVSGHGALKPNLSNLVPVADKIDLDLRAAERDVKELEQAIDKSLRGGRPFDDLKRYQQKRMAVIQLGNLKQQIGAVQSDAIRAQRDNLAGAQRYQPQAMGLLGGAIGAMQTIRITKK